MHISETAGQIFSIRNSVELSRSEDATSVICPYMPHMGLPLDQKILHQCGPEFAECISSKMLDRFTPFKVPWNFLDLKLCNVMVVCPFVPYGLSQGPKTCQIWHQWGPNNGMHISETTGQIYSIQSSVELPIPVVVQHDRNLPICPIWACAWIKILSNLAPDFAEHVSVKSRNLMDYTVQRSMELSKPVVV